jgi:long-subunit fatty acid transport protein
LLAESRISAAAVACALTTSAVLVFAASASAQSTAQMPMQFDFLPPGARSVGMGTAFVAAADDATSAFTNPAGLARLGRREVGTELRFKRLASPYLSGGRISGNVTGVGLDTVPVPTYGSDIDDQLGVNFLSISWPLAAKATLTGYLHQAVTIDNGFFNQGVFQRATFLGETDDRSRELPVGGTRSVDVRSFGGAIGYQVSDRLSLGGGVSVWTFNLDASFARFGIEGNFAGPADRSRTSATAEQDGDDAAAAFNVGGLFDILPYLKVGGSFRRGPSFQFSQRDQKPDENFDLTRHGKFKVPDMWAAGAEWRPVESLRVLVDYNRVSYSQLKKDFLDFQGIATGRPEQLVLEDGNELHTGFEYVFLKAPLPLAFRGGFWVDPDHVVRYVPTAAHDETDTLYQASLPGGETQMHYTAGLGVAASSWLEINGAADISERTKYVTLSTVFRF